MANLGKIFWGLGLFIVDNLLMTLVYPLFKGFMTALTSTDLGDMAMGSTMSAVCWGGFILFYAFLAWIIPIYLFIGGITEN